MVRSPCVKTCKIDAERMLCLGCWRSLDEIMQWLDMDNEQRRAVVARAEIRKAQDAVDGGNKPA